MRSTIAILTIASLLLHLLGWCPERCMAECDSQNGSASTHFHISGDELLGDDHGHSHHDELDNTSPASDHDLDSVNDSNSCHHEHDQSPLPCRHTCDHSGCMFFGPTTGLMKVDLANRLLVFASIYHISLDQYIGASTSSEILSVHEPPLRATSKQVLNSRWLI
jgi:hypothetical protein